MLWAHMHEDHGCWVFMVKSNSDAHMCQWQAVITLQR